MPLGKILLYNTLSRKKEEFKPLKKDSVGMYTCGPTVYWFQHLGNLRAYIAADLLRRVLEFNGFKVRQAMNLTDVGHLTSDMDYGEDKMQKQAEKEGKTIKDIADFYAEDFFGNCKKLNIQKPQIVAKATEHVPEMIELIKKLEAKGFTYQTKIGLIYDTSKFKKYAEFGRLNLEESKAGTRLEADPERKQPSDFALWITNQPKHVMQWQSPWGQGFPGWHIECSAMSLKYLGEEFDIHTGGQDHIQIHHTNEIAQSDGATGKKTVHYWFHVAWLLGMNAVKMSKSSGEVIRLQDLEAEGFNPLDFRFYCLQSHYKSQIVFSLNALKDSMRARTYLQELVHRLLDYTEGKENNEAEKLIEKNKNAFIESINNDLDSPKALAGLFDFARQVNAWINEKNLSKKNAMQVLDFFKEINSVLVVLGFKQEKTKLSEELMALIDEREKLRTQKKWKEADLIRAKLLEKGIQLLDSAEGIKWKKTK